jgi:hypothetical protein
MLPLSKVDLDFWRAELTRSRKQRTDVISQWDVLGNLERYTPKTVMDGHKVDGKVNIAKDFSDVERKNAALFFNTPTIALVPDPGTNQQALLLHQEVINGLLSAKRMDVMATVRPTIQNCLVAIQPVMTEISYRAVSVNVDQQQPVIDPLTQQPVLDPMTQQPAVQVQSVPVIVWEQFSWQTLSPRAGLIPVTQRDSKYDQGAWIGYDFQKPTSQIRTEHGLPDDWTGAALPDKPYFEPLGEQTDDHEPMAGGARIWYRASFRDPTVSHPELIRELVLAEGQDEPLVHRDCPCQAIGPDGRLTPDSMIGYPLHPLALRDLTDSAYCAADCTLTGPLTRELNTFRTDIILRRDGSKLHMLMDTSRVNPEVRDKIEAGGRLPKMIPVEAGALDAGADKIMVQVPAITLGRETYTGQDIIERDRAQILGMDANQVGASGSSKTATEVSTVQRNADARFEQEHTRAQEWFLRGVQKVSALVLRYGDRIAVEILGPARGAAWKQARDGGQFGRFSCEIVMDSGSYIDIEARKRQTLQLYEMTAKDPSLNRGVVQARMATDFGLDPGQWIVSKQPEQKPQPPNVSISVSPIDLDPTLPTYPATFALLTAAGAKGLPPPVQPPPQPMAPGAPPAQHPGMAEKIDHLNKHQSDLTGERSGPPPIM